MMKRLIFAMGVMVASTATAAPRIPDSKAVTSITEAAKMCELTEAGIEWNEKSAKVLAITLVPADLQPPTPKLDLLKTCIFTWAYEREVSLELSMKR